MVKCCVPYCNTVGSNGFHAFPADKKIRKIWIEKTRAFHLTDGELNNYENKVCRRHFKDTELLIDPKGKLRIKSGSIPSLHLPDVINVQTEHNYSLCSDVSIVPLRKTRQVKRRVTKPLAKLEPDDFGFDVQEVEVVTDNVKIELEKANNELKEHLNEKDKLIRAINRKMFHKDKRIKEQRLKRSQMRIQNANVLTYLSQRLNKKQLEFFEMQIENVGKAPQANGYTPQQKSLCLALYKQSAKAYKFLKKFLSLPSKRTLDRHRVRLNFETGINSVLFDYIKAKLDTFEDLDTYCTISWDEVALKAHLDYNQSNDLIDGFVDFSIMRRPTFATHGLTFMVCGINTPYKQAVAYFLTDGIKAFELADLITLVTEAVLDTGLKVILSTCDQASTNASGLDILVQRNYKNEIQDGRIIRYKIRDTTIIHCYDPSHLIKGIRNNLYKKYLKHHVLRRWKRSDGPENVSETERVASWDDVEALYKFDSSGSRKLLEKITDEHIKPNKEKMKVSVAAQVFSLTYGRVMLHCSKKSQLPTYFNDTAEILIFFNDVFDSINGSSIPLNDELKASVTKNSAHFKFWEYTLRMLSKMQFIDKITGKNDNRSKVLLNFESTIRGYIEISTRCLNLKMAQVPIRSMNQDGLENFFGCLRMCCHNSASLIASHFRSSFITAILNNLTNSNSLKSNCEADSTVPLLDNVHELLTVKKPETNNSLDNKDNKSDYDEGKNLETTVRSRHETIVFDPHFTVKNLNFVENESMSSVSSKMCYKILQRTRCRACRNTIESSTKLDEHEIIPTENSMKCPSASFIRSFKNLLCFISQLIPHICAEKSIKATILSEIEKKNFDMDDLGCSKHASNIGIKLKQYTTDYGIATFCKIVNNLLSGKVSSLAPNFNRIEELAFSFREKRKHIGKYTCILQRN